MLAALLRLLSNLLKDLPFLFRTQAGVSDEQALDDDLLDAWLDDDGTDATGL